MKNEKAEIIYIIFLLIIIKRINDKNDIISIIKTILILLSFKILIYYMFHFQFLMIPQLIPLSFFYTDKLKTILNIP
jgi:hypothetical protein